MRNSHAVLGRSSLQWLLLGTFIIAVALLGGSSRPDPIQNALLQPFFALLLIPMIPQLAHDDLRRAKAPLIFLALFTGWMVAQLIPLPPEIWQTLPGRQVIAKVDHLAGFDGLWRPLSFSPFRGLNSLLGMIVPVTAVVIALVLKASERQLLLGLVAIGLVNALLGLLQVIGGAEGAFYMYANTSRGAPAGIFANENHSAVFSAVVLLVLVRLALTKRWLEDLRWIRFSFAPVFLLILLAILVTGSRAGLMAALLSLAAACVMTWLAFASGRDAHKGSGLTLRREGTLALPLAGFAAAIVLTVMAFLWFGRTPAFIDMVERTSFEDLRWSLWPVLQRMMADHWRVGTGFGSFDAIYRVYEPTELLLPAYVNHAHNDWAQLVIEGGLPSVLLLTASLFWIGMAIRQLSIKPDHDAAGGVFWLAIILIVGAASVVDYPLRTPIFQVALAWLAVCLASEKSRKIFPHSTLRRGSSANIRLGSL